MFAFYREEPQNTSPRPLDKRRILVADNASCHKSNCLHWQGLEPIFLSPHSHSSADNTKGLLLPKPSGQDQPVRLQHAFRVKITANEKAPMDTTRSLFEVQLKWEQNSHAKFFDKKKGGQSLSSAEPLPSDLLKKEDQNQQNLKAIL